MSRAHTDAVKAGAERKQFSKAKQVETASCLQVQSMAQGLPVDSPAPLESSK